MPNTPKTKWEEMFDEKFVEKDALLDEDFIADFIDGKIVTSTMMKDFIRQTLQEELSLLEEKYKHLPNVEVISKQGNKEVKVELEAVFRKDVLTIIRQHKEELTK